MEERGGSVGVAVQSLPPSGKGTADQLRQGGALAMQALDAIGRALGTAGSMTWGEIFCLDPTTLPLRS